MMANVGIGPRMSQLGEVSRSLLSILEDSPCTEELLPLKERFHAALSVLEDFGSEVMASYRQISDLHGYEPGYTELRVAGGRAKGTPIVEESDLDLLILTESPLKSFGRNIADGELAREQFAKRCDELRAEFDIKVPVHFINPRTLRLGICKTIGEPSILLAAEVVGGRSSNVASHKDSRFSSL